MEKSGFNFLNFIMTAQKSTRNSFTSPLFFFSFVKKPLFAYLAIVFSLKKGPSPVMLSSPYSKNASFATGQPLDSSQMSSSSSATQGSSAGSMAASKRGAAQRANSSPYRQPASRTSRKPQRKSESDEGASTSSSKPRAGRGKKPPHELLSEAEKKANHIASEQKRRQNIRVGFDQLVDIVPALSQSHRSEALILQKCKFEWEHDGVVHDHYGLRALMRFASFTQYSCGSYTQARRYQE